MDQNEKNNLKNIEKIYICPMIKVNRQLYNKIKEPSLSLRKTTFDGNCNKSFLFLLPLTGYKKSLHESTFVNCFYDSTTKLKDLDNVLYILSKYTESSHDYIKSLDNYIYNYYAGKDNNNKYYMYCLKINNNYYNDYKLIIDSRYSEISKETKSLLENYNYFNPVVEQKKNETYKSTIGGIINKRLWLQKQLVEKLNIDKKDLENKEYWSKFDDNIDKEIYKYGKNS